MMDRKYLVFLGLGFELVVLVVAFLYGGAFIDQRMQWPGYGVAGGAVVALVGWMIHLVVIYQALDAQDSDSQRP